MEDSLKDDGKGSIEKLKTALDKLISFLDTEKLSDSTRNLLTAFKKLRSENWGRVPKEESDWPASNTKQFYPEKQPSPTNESFMVVSVFFFFKTQNIGCIL